MKRTQHHSMSVLTGNTRCFSKAADKQDLAFGLVVTRFGFACTPLERSHSQEENKNWTTRKRVDKKRRNSSHTRSKLVGVA